MQKQQQGFGQITQREQGLKRRLTSGQMSMIAIGGAIGTGLFLGSKFAIGFAGPSVIISYAIGGLITLLLIVAGYVLVTFIPGHATGRRTPSPQLPRRGQVVRWPVWPGQRPTAANFSRLIALPTIGG